MFRVAALAWEPMSSSLRSLHHIASLEKSSSITEGGHWGLESVSREWQLQGLSVFLRLVRGQLNLKRQDLGTAQTI